MTIKSTKMVVWKLEFLVILQNFFHCGSTQPCGASLSIHCNGNRRRQLYWSNVMDWPLPLQYKKRPMYWSRWLPCCVYGQFGVTHFMLAKAWINLHWSSNQWLVYASDFDADVHRCIRQKERPLYWSTMHTLTTHALIYIEKRRS